MRWTTFKGIVVGYFDTFIIWGDRFMLSVWESERFLIITSVPHCCFKLFERDRGCSTGWYCYKRLQAIDGVAVDAKGKGEATQIADEEIWSKTHHGADTKGHNDHSGITAFKNQSRTLLSLSINLLRRSKKACIRFMWSPPVFSRAGRSCVCLSKEVPKKHRKAQHSGLPAWRQNLEKSRR